MPEAEKSVNGSDLIAFIDGKAAGHSSTHTLTISAETKEHVFKPAASVPQSNASLFKNKTVTGVNVQVSTEGLVFYGETEESPAALAEIALSGEPVALKLYHRGNDGTGNTDKPWISGQFVCTNFVNTAPAGDDATYSAQFENTGPITSNDENFLKSLVSA